MILNVLVRWDHKIVQSYDPNRDFDNHDCIPRFSVCPVYCSRDLQVPFSFKTTSKLGSMALFTHLKMILLQCFQFSIFNNKQYPKTPYIWQFILLFNLFLLLFMGPITLFGTIYGSHCTISTNF